MERKRYDDSFVSNRFDGGAGTENLALPSLFPLFLLHDVTHGLHDARSVTGPALGCARL